MSMEYVPDRELTPPEDDRKKVYDCNDCGCDIMEGDGYYVVKGDVYCDNCIEHNHNYAELCSHYWEDDGDD